MKVRTSSRDPPFMSPLVKYLLKKRKKAIGVGDEESTFRLQNQIKTLIRANQLMLFKMRTKIIKLEQRNGGIMLITLLAGKRKILHLLAL